MTKSPSPALAGSLARIADTLARMETRLEQLAPTPTPMVDPRQRKCLRWDGVRLQLIASLDALPLARFVGVDRQAAALSRNIAALVEGAPAHDMLLWGSRGMGKSALLRALVAERLRDGLGIVEAAGDRLATLSTLFGRLEGAGPFLVFVDDLAFQPGDPDVRLLRSLLDGGVSARPANVRLAVTSNHRHLVARTGEDGGLASLDSAARHGRDAADDQLALVDRFGLVLGFHAPDQADYLAMVRGYLAAEGLALDEQDAIAFALARGGRSGRTAWHYRTEILARRATSA